MSLSNVDLPAPFAPTMPKRSPGPISQVTSSRILRPATVIFCAAEVTCGATDSSVTPLRSASASAFALASAAAWMDSGTPASTRRGSASVSTATSTEPVTRGSEYREGTISI